MRTLRWSIGLLMALAALPASPQTVAGVDLAAMKAASRDAVPGALDTLASIVNERNARKLGFPGPNAVGGSRIVEPFVDFTIGIQGLRGYRSGDDTVKLMHASGMIIYPLDPGGGRFPSITLVHLDDRWQTASFGSPNHVSAFVTARAELAGRENLPLNGLFQLRVPAFNLVFVGYLRGAELMLTSVFDHPTYDLSARRVYPADEVLLRLVEPAQRHAGAPG